MQEKMKRYSDLNPPVNQDASISGVVESDGEVCENCGSTNVKQDGVCGFSQYGEMEHSWAECLDCGHCWD